MSKTKEIPLGMQEYHPNAATVFAEGLKEHGTEMAFGVHGADLWNIIDPMSRMGIKLITVHHEQTAVYAAEAYSKVTGKAGVFYSDMGPGTANLTSALQQCYLSCSPAVGLCGGAVVGHERAYTVQPSYAEQMFGRITKWTQRVFGDFEVKHFIAKAFKDAHAYPKGPCVIEFSQGSMLGTPMPPIFVSLVGGMLYRPRWRREDTGKPLPPPGADPELVEKAVRLICEAKNPVIFAGDGVHWSGAGKELMEFAELAQIPVSGRHLGQGAMPGTHPLHFSSRIHGQILPQCDLMVLLGMKVGFFDSSFGLGWPRCIQINESPEHIWEYLDTEMILLGGPKVVLKQMIECMKANKLAPPEGRKEWVQKVSQAQKEADERLHARALKYKDHKPVHHGFLCKTLWDTCEELYGGTNRIIIDGFTISAYIPPFLKARYSAQIMDASEQAGVGHGIGMAIGAALSDPETQRRPIISLMGDAGMGNSGFDIETAARYELPIVYVVTNNNGWLGGMRYHSYGKNWDALGEQDRPHGQSFLPDIRYEKLADMFGIHGEYVNDPAELRLALERALRSAEQGKTAVVNVIVDPTIVHPAMYSFGYAAAFGHIPYEELPKRGKAIRRFYHWGFPWDEIGVPEVAEPDPWEPVTEEEMMP